jgi:hypothetical protein
MKHFSYFLILLINNFLYSQEIKITVIDSLNQSPIQEAIALDTAGQFLTKSDSEGVLLITKDQSKVYITANGYKQTMITLAQNENFICKINKNPEELKEVFIGKKPTATKYGNLNISHGSFSTDSQACNPKYKNLTCATQIIAVKNINVAFYNFCIYEKTNNSPFNFQIYNDKDGKPDQVVYSQYVKNYKKGWNRIAVDDANFSLNPGTYYIAMQWIPLEDKSDVWFFEADGKRYYSIGQTLGINKGDDNQLDSFIYKDNWEKTPRLHTGKKGNYTQYIEALEN